MLMDCVRNADEDTNCKQATGDQDSEHHDGEQTERLVG